MDACGIVKSFNILKYQTICWFVVARFKAVQPFVFDNCVK